MGLKEILAAKKAAAEQAEKESSNAQAESTTKAEAQTGNEQTSSASPSKNETQSINVQYKPSVSEGAQSNRLESEVLVDANGKPLSGFALIKRRKEIEAAKKLAEEQGAKNVRDETVRPESAANVPAVVESIIEHQSNLETPVQSSTPAVLSEAIAEDVATNEAYTAATPETRQAYSDLKERINNLCTLSDTDLKNAMTELKKALMQNTNAVALMLPSDIGQMVIALRKMTGVELAKAEEKKTGKKSTGKSKEPALTAEQLEDVFKEL